MKRFECRLNFKVHEMDFQFFVETIRRQEKKLKHGVYRLFEIYSWLEDGKATKARIRYFVKIEIDKQILRRIHRGIAD